jgi:hypothetical protein
MVSKLVKDWAGRVFSRFFEAHFFFLVYRGVIIEKRGGIFFRFIRLGYWSSWK